MPDAASQILLVEKAICSGVGGCLEWVNEKTQSEVRNLANLRGLTPRAIKQILIDRVKTRTHRIDARIENRPPYRDYREFYFRVLVIVPALPKELFIELELTIDDEEYPVVTILNAHLQER